MSKFGFGITRDNDQFYDYFDVYGQPNVNAVFALNFPGLALRFSEYETFANNLVKSSNDTFRCESDGIGSCSA